MDTLINLDETNGASAGLVRMAHEQHDSAVGANATPLQTSASHATAERLFSGGGPNDGLNSTQLVSEAVAQAATIDLAASTDRLSNFAVASPTSSSEHMAVSPSAPTSEHHGDDRLIDFDVNHSSADTAAPVGGGGISEAQSDALLAADRHNTLDEIIFAPRPAASAAASQPDASVVTHTYGGGDATVDADRTKTGSEHTVGAQSTAANVPAAGKTNIAATNNHESAISAVGGGAVRLQTTKTAAPAAKANRIPPPGTRAPKAMSSPRSTKLAPPPTSTADRRQQPLSARTAPAKPTTPRTTTTTTSRAATTARPKPPGVTTPRAPTRPAATTPLRNASAPTTPRGVSTPPTNKKYEHVRSRISSKTDYQPGGGTVKIFNQKIEVKKVHSKVGSLDFAAHTPGGGNVKVETRKLDFKERAKPKVAAASDYKPGGGDKKIESRKLDWKAESKVGSMSNATHKPTGGVVKIESKKLNWKAESKIGSMQNADHKPAGGNVKIYDEKLKIDAKPKIGSMPETPGAVLNDHPSPNTNLNHHPIPHADMKDQQPFVAEPNQYD